MKFVDEVVVYVRSGKGGDGSVSFLREKFRPFGGPDGGDGGNGGHVIFVGDPQLSTLLDLRFLQHHRAENGQPGMGRQKYGKRGEDHRIRVPVGTVIEDADTGEVLGDVTSPGQELIAARGGHGGRGNIHLATSTNQTPRRSEPGELAVERRIRLTLKLIADVGLVGFPNAGKSTLISRISAARPKIADYPFTTLVPNLGIVQTSLDHSFAVADIPGLIEGAAGGAGLGHRFLRHIERVSVIAVLIESVSMEERDPVESYRVLMRELAAYSPLLVNKPRVLVLTKCDLLEDEAIVERVEALATEERCSFFAISAVRGDGLDALSYGLQGMVDRERSERDSASLIETDDDAVPDEPRQPIEESI